LKKRFLTRMLTAVFCAGVIFAHSNIKALAAYAEWKSSSVYVVGDKVTYKDKDYQAKWWTRGDIPDKQVANEWDNPWELADDSESGGSGNTTTVSVVYPDYSNVDVVQGISTWPKTIFAPFVDSTAWPPYSMTTEAADTNVPYYNLGFIVSESAKVCKPTWGTYYSAEQGPINDEIKRIRQAGGDVIVSFGGAANVPLHVAAPDVDSLKEQYKKFIKAYGITRIDFDIEGIWVEDKAANTRNGKALKDLQAELKAENYPLQVWYTLPVLPTGLVPSGINLLKSALDNGVDIAGVNVMTMDYGDWALPNPSGKMGQAGIDAITSVKDQLKNLYSAKGIKKTESELWAMIGTTPMIGINDIQT
jgi:chitinase